MSAKIRPRETTEVPATIYEPTEDEVLAMYRACNARHMTPEGYSAWGAVSCGTSAKTRFMLGRPLVDVVAETCFKNQPIERGERCFSLSLPGVPVPAPYRNSATPMLNPPGAVSALKATPRNEAPEATQRQRQQISLD